MYQSGEGFKRRDFDTAERMYLSGCGYRNKDACQAARLLAHENETATRESKVGDKVACSVER
jgi:TPR repeat protein